MLIGLDGATFDVIDPLIAQGRLPHLAGLMRRGVRAPLESTIPIVSWAAWPAMMTGKYPGKHGVYYHLRRHGYDERVVTSRDMRAPGLWDLLGQRGRRVAAVGVPLTYPPREINGVMVSGVPMPRGLHTYPLQLAPELSAAAPGYPIADGWRRALRRGGLEGLARHVERGLDLSARAALHLLRRERWSAFICVLCELDRLQHFVPWPRDGSAPEAAVRRSVVARCYEKADAAVGEIVAAAGDDAAVIVASDHGFGDGRRGFFLNRWLAERGWLRIKGKARRRLRLVRRTAGDALAALGRPAWGRIAQVPLWVPRWTLPAPQELIDWDHTCAFGATGYLDGVRINLRGREPRGIVEPGAQYEQLRDELIAALGEVRDPRTAEAVVTWARRREEVFAGPYVAEAPDVIYATRENRYPESGRLDAREAIGADPDGQMGSHRLEGILVMAGPGIGRGRALPRCRIVDVAPTALYLLGLPVSEDMDGAVLLDALDQDYLGHRPVALCAEEELAAYTTAAESQREQEQMAEQLRALGYM